jgi:hypothetical protein
MSDIVPPIAGNPVRLIELMPFYRTILSRANRATASRPETTLRVLGQWWLDTRSRCRTSLGWSVLTI